MPTFGSLFSGIGGLDLGLERAGWECRWQVEIDEWCRRVLARHWPSVPRWADARTFLACADAHPERCVSRDKPEEGCEGEPCGFPKGLGSPTVDLLVGGFPCQPVSHAGPRTAQDDARWLWPSFARLIRLLRPRFVLVENVPGLLAPVRVKDDQGKTLGWFPAPIEEVLGDLAESGFDAEWDCVPAAAVGASHLRDRVWIVAYPDSSGLSEWFRGPLGTETGNAEPERLRGTGGEWWTVEPNVGRVAHGVPARVDRLRGLGNAVVPQVAEWIGQRLLMATPNGGSTS